MIVSQDSNLKPSSPRSILILVAKYSSFRCLIRRNISNKNSNNSFCTVTDIGCTVYPNVGNPFFDISQYLLFQFGSGIINSAKFDSPVLTSSRSVTQRNKQCCLDTAKYGLEVSLTFMYFYRVAEHTNEEYCTFYFSKKNPPNFKLFLRS